MWICRKVISGGKKGRILGYPTLNFHVGRFGKNHKEGVYACQVKIHNKLYRGALYYGPKLSGPKVLEVFVLDFKKEIYDQFVSFQVGKWVRAPRRFNSLTELKKQIKADLKNSV